MGLGKMRQGFLSPYPLVFLVLARTAQRRREQKACSMFQNVSLDRSRREHETTRELLSNPFKPWDGRVVSNGHQKTLFVSSWEVNCIQKYCDKLVGTRTREITSFDFHIAISPIIQSTLG